MQPMRLIQKNNIALFYLMFHQNGYDEVVSGSRINNSSNRSTAVVSGVLVGSSREGEKWHDFAQQC
jgi:hypothetical protein